MAFIPVLSLPLIATKLVPVQILGGIDGMASIYRVWAGSK